MNKNILITGASQRIGKELCLYFAKMGWNIAIHFNKSKKQANVLKKELERYGVKCVCIQANLLNTITIKKIIDTSNKSLGSINCIINNASIFNNDNILNFNEKSWNEHIKINLLAPATFIKEFSKIKNLSENKSIINILDQRIFKLTPYFFSYTISKTGLHTIYHQIDDINVKYLAYTMAVLQPHSSQLKIRPWYICIPKGLRV